MRKKLFGVLFTFLLLAAAGITGYLLWNKMDHTPAEEVSGYSLTVPTTTFDDLVPVPQETEAEPEQEEPPAEEEPAEEPEETAEPEEPPAEEAEPEPETQSFYELAGSASSFEDLGITLEAGQAFLYDLNEGKILAMKGVGDTLYPASTTKLLTILTAFEYLDPETEITAGSEVNLTGENSSVAWIGQGQTLTAEQIAAGMLIPSGNDAAYVLAAAVGRKLSGDPDLSGSEASAALVPLMNEYAQSLGMEHSSFSNVDGYFAQDHYSTAEDMLLLAIAAYDDSVIRKYCGVAEMDAPHIADFKWVTSNDMLLSDSSWYDPRVKGLKTGSLTDSYCLIAVLEEDGHTYLSGVFSCTEKSGRYRDTEAIADYLFPSGSAEE